MSHTLRRRALIVADERKKWQGLWDCLATAGFVTEGAVGADALRRTREAAFDLLVLDVMLSGIDGCSLCRSIRTCGPNAEAPLLLITDPEARGAAVSGLECGADDYVTVPFAAREFLARVGALIRRRERIAGAASPDPIPGSVVSIDRLRREVLVRGQRVALTRQEFNLLCLLAARPGMVFSRSVLLAHAHPDDGSVSERAIDSLISRLRSKIEPEPRSPTLIQTAWGVGYRFGKT